MARDKLALRTMSTSVIGILSLAALPFVPAGTIDYWQGWLFIVVFSGSTTAIGVYLALKDPALLRRRMQVGPTAEQSIARKIIISLSFFSLLAVIVFSALDHRFGWSPIPAWVSILGAGLVALELFIDLLVFRETLTVGPTFAWRTVSASSRPDRTPSHATLCTQGC